MPGKNLPRAQNMIIVLTKPISTTPDKLINEVAVRVFNTLSAIAARRRQKRFLAPSA
jgi:hypothetical protein